MKIHILGIAGTFMAGIARIAAQLGHTVTGSDTGVYPPMSHQLANDHVTVFNQYLPLHLQPAPDLVIVGNAMSRAEPVVEYMLNEGIPYISGPQWLYQEVLVKKWVLAVAGTHGKTTTSSMLTWILQANDYNPSYLIGGIPGNFSYSAHINNSSRYFVIEADEYDTAFFDKRAKFVHYHPRTLILNNLEFDHADIYTDVSEIKRQFHHLVRTVPGQAQIIYPASDQNILEVLGMGCWSARSLLHDDAHWQARIENSDGSRFVVLYQGREVGEVNWPYFGKHNVSNALAAVAAAHHIGVDTRKAVAALAAFKACTRRMEIKGVINGVTLYDDFAHHPTAIRTTLAGLRAHLGDSARIICVLELGSYTMRSGYHRDTLAGALRDANEIVIKHREDTDWDVRAIQKGLSSQALFSDNTQSIVDHLTQVAKPGDHLIVMSNSGFDGIWEKLLSAI